MKKSEGCPPSNYKDEAKYPKYDPKDPYKKPSAMGEHERNFHFEFDKEKEQWKIPQPQGGYLYSGGTKGHKSEHRKSHARITRDSLLNAAGDAEPTYVRIRDLWLEQAEAALLEDPPNAINAERCQKSADRIQERYLELGMGKKAPVNVLGRDAWIELTFMVTKEFLTGPELDGWLKAVKNKIEGISE